MGDSGFSEAGFTLVLRPAPEPSSPQALIRAQLALSRVLRHRFLAALVSRSCNAPHAHLHSRRDNGSSSTRTPHSAHILLLGNQRLAVTSSAPYSLALLLPFCFRLCHRESLCSSSAFGPASFSPLDSVAAVLTPRSMPRTWKQSPHAALAQYRRLSPHRQPLSRGGPDPARVASMYSNPKRISLSRCSTTMSCTFGLRKIRKSAWRRPFQSEPISCIPSTARKPCLGTAPNRMAICEQFSAPELRD